MTATDANPVEGAAAGRRRRVPPLLVDATFRRYWLAQSISYLGDQVTIVALPLLAVLLLDASAAQVGLLSAAATAPSLLFALHAGAVVDRRGHRRRAMIVTDIGRAVALATLPAAYWLDLLSLSQLYVVAFVAGTFTVVFNVAANGFFGCVVPRDSYVEGTALLNGSYSFSWVVGPGVGGILVQVLTGPIALVVDVVSFVGSAVLLRSIAPPEPGGEERVRGHVREGLQFVARTPALLAKFAAGTTLNFFYFIYFALLFLFAARELDLSPAAIGVVLGAGAVGALIGSAVTTGLARKLGVGPAFVAGTFLYPAALLLVPLAGGPRWLAIAMLVLAELGSGFGLMVSDITGASIQQALTPDRLRARVQGAYLLTTNGARPLGSLVGGGLGTWLGLRPSLWIAAIGATTAVLVLLPSPLRSMKDLPEQAG